jgi:hypothetical protein
MKGFPGKDNVYFEENAPISKCKFVGIVRETEALGQKDLYRIEVRNRIEVGDEIDIVLPPGQDDLCLQIKEMINLDEESVDVAHGGDKDVYFRLKEGLPEMALLRRNAVDSD